MIDLAMDDYHFLDSFKNKRIHLTLRTATYAGTVQRINLNKSVLLGDVVDVKSGRKFAGTKLFFGHEIVNVELPNARKPELGNKEESNHSTEGQLALAEFLPYRKSMKLDGDDNDGDYVDFVVIDEFFEKFGPAVMDIRKQHVIGIGADGVGVSQYERLCWLQIATKTRVYLFDILLLGARAFKNGLSMILESDRVLKVTHDCRGIAGCLWIQYGVNLCNVFDTQVADVMYFHAETGGFLPERVSTLQEVVGLHLKMSPSYLASLKIKAQLTKEDNEIWYVRPCPVSLLKVMALSVIYLQPLRMILLEELMSDYIGRVDSYLAASREEPVNTQSIGKKSGLELPAELRELESLRRDRQEWASATYPLTEDGLLVRSCPKPSAGESGEGHAFRGSDTTLLKEPEQYASRELGVNGEQVRSLAVERSSEVIALEPSLFASSSPCSCSTRGNPGETVFLEEAPLLAVGRAKPLETVVIGRGQKLSGEAMPPAGRGLCLPTPPRVSKELSEAASPHTLGRACNGIQAPAPLSQRGPVASSSPLGTVLGVTMMAPSGTMPGHRVSFGRGLFFQKPQVPSSQFNLSLSSLK
ncbi:hypothetical protein GJAV_G00012860 [Gymnothorax javanicus]|nr:hypothetical protein GJAV_G00012860 [Gymnothorax javanicus]